MRELIDTGAKYVIALVVVVGCLILIFQAKGDETQAWTIIGLVIGWIIRDSAGNSSSANLVRLAQAQPTVTTGGNPPRTTVTPTEVPA
jgi:hypothetical protein